MKTLRIIVVVVAGLGALKALIAVIWPSLAQRTVDWWLGLPDAMGRIVGTLLGLVGLALVAYAVAKTGNAVIGAAVLIGAFAAGWGVLYQYPRIWHGVVKPFSSTGGVWMLRLMAVFWLLVCGALLFIGLRGWGG